MGPAVSAKCSQCGNKVRVPYYSLLYSIPFLISAVYLILVKINAISIIAFIITFVFYLVMHLKFAPLIPKVTSNP